MIQSSSTLVYTAGDVAVIYPHNDLSLVKRAKALLPRYDIQISTNTTIKITNHLEYSRKSRLQSMICTIDELFEKYLDIAGRPKRSFFESLAVYALNSEEKNKLLELSSAEGTDLFFDYCINVSNIT